MSLNTGREISNQQSGEHQELLQPHTTPNSTAL